MNFFTSFPSLKIFLFLFNDSISFSWDYIIRKGGFTFTMFSHIPISNANEGATAGPRTLLWEISIGASFIFHYHLNMFHHQLDLQPLLMHLQHPTVSEPELLRVLHNQPFQINRISNGKSHRNNNNLQLTTNNFVTQCLELVNHKSKLLYRSWRISYCGVLPWIKETDC